MQTGKATGIFEPKVGYIISYLKLLNNFPSELEPNLNPYSLLTPASRALWHQTTSWPLANVHLRAVTCSFLSTWASPPGLSPNARLLREVPTPP